MALKHFFISCLFPAFLAIGHQAEAGPEPSEQTTRLVQQVTDMFFDQLPRHEFDVEYGFASTLFYEQTSAEDWRALRMALVDLVEQTPRYRPHAMTYYERETLYAAVDFSGSVDADTDICGYVIWEMPNETTIGFVRLEQNIVDHTMMAGLSRTDAIGLMQSWHCPQALIAGILGLSS